MLRVLIVDDSSDDAELTEFALREAGLEIECRRACNAEAVQAIGGDGFVPHLVLCDLNLPGWSCQSALAAAGRMAPGAFRVILTGALPPDGDVPEADAVMLKDDLSDLAVLARRLAARRGSGRRQETTNMFTN